ncbi:MAG: hypothetical protein IJ714_02695 [Bacteroidales bacterium]|nr:hypothetical protein [Bacteroidales bacterium]
MNKSLLPILVLLLASCDKESATIYPGAVSVRIEGAAAVSTKTSYDGNDSVGEFFWDVDDQIAVHYSSGGYTTLTVNHQTGAVNAASTQGNYRDYYAVYPATAAVASHYGNPNLRLTLPASYDISAIVSGSSGLSADFSPCPMVADNNANSDFLDFYHVGGLLRIVVTAVPPGTARLRVVLDKDITGTYDVSNPGTREPTIATKGAASGSAVTFIVGGSSGASASETDPIVLNVPVPTGSYGQIAVEALNTGGTVLTSVSSVSEYVFRRHYGKKFYLRQDEGPQSYTFQLVLEDEIVWNKFADVRIADSDNLLWGEGNEGAARIFVPVLEGINW